MKSFLKKYGPVILCFLFFNVEAPAQIGENRLKSIWLEKFSKFIEWPTTDTLEYFTITILGEGDINQYLFDIYENRTIKNKPVKINVINKIDNIEYCNILFVNTGQAKELDKVLDRVKSKPILTIGDTQGFAKKGVIINFYLEQNKVRFELNISAAKSSGLDIDFRLLEAARIIKKI
ncbi:YfiR family protein [Fulvivirga sp. 29W222]|uniref:YfiR family protein n=1 Tax=Fulvivirga marina TaxID=2494733 RepID=A0A937KCV6_9BACT|nr:YfiR family protein [Fulvivirga marina]MBL6445593.1 YfiR family protein [Fulvivirga marina]